MDRTVKIGSSIEDLFDADQLTVTITISGICNTKEECATAYNTNLAAVRSKLRQANVPDSAISTRYFSLSAHTERLYRKKKGNGDYYYAKTEVQGYSYSGKVIAKTSDIELSTPIWLALSDCGDSVTFDMDFDLADENAARESLLARAVKSGEAKARILAKASGAELGPISSIEYDFENRRRGYYDGALYAPDFLGDDDQAPEFTPEPISISCKVNCIWTLQ
ncbi:SIMPL domain-containing protein [Bifidobacterium sp. CP2]|uniref:SIMPL domain-containing protein n=1 Tax=Bifidobacterium sp. CP2 TaxID=2809025 RepID=UPI001BDC6AAD|nr:SIMPL domain-containing protein [Bifidobacterium sp. CP2]MBT1181198.1 SIMPL domain-containing protein [Bifidobacterium sp. CP2]